MSGTAFGCEVYNQPDMKTQVIQLDIHDDLISIRDRMAWAKTPRILLVWPKRGGVDVRPLDLTLLRRHAESLGAELGLVTRNGEIRAAARELHISVFSKSSDAQKKQWQERRPARPVRRFPRLDLRSIRLNLPAADLFTFAANPVRRVLVFAVGVLALLAVVLAFIPSAEIQIALPEQKQVLTIAVSSKPDIKSVQISGLVPQHKFILTVAGKDTALPSGSAAQSGQVAAGEVLLMNLTDKAVHVPSGTILLTHSDPPVSFVTDKDVDVPAGKGKTASISIQASAAGLDGNVDPGAITLFEGSLGFNLAVTNPDATSGATLATVAAATDQDRDNLRKRLLAELRIQALKDFTERVSKGDVLFPDTLTQTRVISESFDPPAGQPGEKLSLSVQVEYSAAYASYSDLRLLAERVLNASMPAGYDIASSQVDLKSVSGFSESQGIVHWQMRVQRGMRALLDPGQVSSIVQGKTLGNAGSLLTETFGLAQSPQININPGWWPWLPFLPIRISVKG
jgi:hypothetical protein